MTVIVILNIIFRRYQNEKKKNSNTTSGIRGFVFNESKKFILARIFSLNLSGGAHFQSFLEER